MQDYILEVNGVQQKMIYVETPKETLTDTDFYWTDIGKGFPDGYWLGETPVTQEFWQAVMGEPWEKCRFRSKGRPVDTVSWNNLVGEAGKYASGFFHELNIHRNKVEMPATQRAGSYQLPSEAQWEFAARGGLKTILRKYKFSAGNNANDSGWNHRNSGGCSRPVALKLPNELGLYDMSGNVWEWSADYYAALGLQPRSGNSFQRGDISESKKVVRGGSWLSPPEGLSMSNRDRDHQGYVYGDIGCRLARY